MSVAANEKDKRMIRHGELQTNITYTYMGLLRSWWYTGVRMEVLSADFAPSRGVHPAMQRQTAVTAYFTSTPLLLFAFA